MDKLLITKKMYLQLRILAEVITFIFVRRGTDTNDNNISIFFSRYKYISLIQCSYKKDVSTESNNEEIIRQIHYIELSVRQLV